MAERFGRSPEEVDDWDLYWFNRSVEWIEGEAIAMKPKTPKGPKRLKGR